MALHHGFGAGILQHITHEAAVDLQHADRQRPQMRQRRHPGAEIIQRNGAAAFAQPLHQGFGLCEVARRNAFGQLETERLRGDAAAGDLLDDEVREASVAQRLSGKIDVEDHRAAGQQCRLRRELPHASPTTQRSTAGMSW